MIFIRTSPKDKKIKVQYPKPKSTGKIAILVRKFLTIIFLLVVVTVMIPAKSNCYNDLNAKSNDTSFNGVSDKSENFRTSKKTSLFLYNHGKSAVGFGLRWFTNDNYIWAYGTNDYLKKNINEIVAAIVSFFVLLIEFIWNLIVYYLVGVVSVIYGVVVMILGLILVPVIWIFNAFLWILRFLF
jgi:hypothetical protein